MSQATTIWVAQIGFAVVAAFTVRHEMVSWLRKQDIGNPQMVVYKVPDNLGRYVASPVKVYTPAQILEMFG